VRAVDHDVEEARARLICVDPKLVHLIWPHVVPLLRGAIARTGISAFADIERESLGGDALLWIAVSGKCSVAAIEAVASTSLQQTDAGKVCVITACADTNMSRWLPLVAGIEAYARDESCKRVRIFGREGWLRVLNGYRQTNVPDDSNLIENVGNEVRQIETGAASCCSKTKKPATDFAARAL
jgi:hypothetical protein